MKTLTIIGTRPQIIKLCDWETDIIYTNQHYDWSLNRELTTHYRNVRVLERHDCEYSERTVELIEAQVGSDIPDVVIVHGDCFSTISGALYAVNKQIPLAHIESGVRSNSDTVEENIRKRVDHISTFNFCPTIDAVNNLRDEGITKHVYWVGDVLYDRYLKDREPYVFCTIHRRENMIRLQDILDRLKDIEYEIRWPIHPHTKRVISENKLSIPDNIRFIDPVGYDATVEMVRSASMVVTDSGGVERQAMWCGTPCLVERENSEWRKYSTVMSEFGDGHAGEKIYRILTEMIDG